MKAQSSLPAACFALGKILALSAEQHEVLMHVQCHGSHTGDQTWKSRSRMAQTPEWHTHLQTPLAVWIPRWCWERRGKNWAADTRQSHLAVAARSKGRWGGVSGKSKAMRKEDLLKLVSILSSLSTAFHYLGQAAWWIFLLSALGFFLWSHAVLCSQMAFSMPLCFPSVKHVIKTHSFQKVIYTLVTLHIKYLGIFKGKQ